MIVRSPPVKKRREDHPSSPSPLQPTDGDSSHHMLCTYQCRQMVKSDFLDALSNAEKQVEDYKSRLEALNDNFCKVELERKKFRDQYLYTEQELSAAQGREQALQEQQLKEVHDFQERFSKQIRSYTELETHTDLLYSDIVLAHPAVVGFENVHVHVLVFILLLDFQVKLQNEINLRTKAETSAASAEEKASVLEGKLSHLSESIEGEKRHLNNDLAHIKKESKLSAARINADLERMECRARNAEKESQLLKGQLDDLKNQLNECLQQKSEAETKLSTLTFQEVKCTDNDILVKHLQEELRNFEAEVRAARKLKSSHEDVKLLNEKLLEEKGRRERAESELSKLQEFQSSMKKLENELTSWKLTTKDIPGVSCCDDIPVKFGALQKEVIDSTKREGEATARLKQLEVALDAALIGKQNAETEAELMRERLEVTKSEVKRIELMLSRVTEERDKLRNDINEFKLVKSDGAGDEATSRTLKELESSLANKEGYIKELESALFEQKQVNSFQHEEIKSLNDRLKTEARKVKSLEREGGLSIIVFLPLF
ncbi:hypothetical protein ACLB2K_045427 [Fragaria x ananassa]